jgi:hypothetical protein
MLLYVLLYMLLYMLLYTLLYMLLCTCKLRMSGRIFLSGSERLGEDRLGFETLQKMYKSLEILIKNFPVPVLFWRGTGELRCPSTCSSISIILRYVVRFRLRPLYLRENALVIHWKDVLMGLKTITDETPFEMTKYKSTQNSRLIKQSAGWRRYWRRYWRWCSDTTAPCPVSFTTPRNMEVDQWSNAIDVSAITKPCVASRRRVRMTSCQSCQGEYKRSPVQMQGSLASDFFTPLPLRLPSGSWPHFTGLRDHIIRHTTVRRTPLDEWSARRRDLYLTTHNTHNRETSMRSAAFEPAIPERDRPQTNAFNRTDTGVGPSFK